MSETLEELRWVDVDEEAKFSIRSEDVKEVQKILSLLADFSEKVSRTAKDAEHHARKALAAGDEEEVSFRIAKIGGGDFLYIVEGNLRAQSKETSVSTVWIHEDGIAQERVDFMQAGQAHHPVFDIVCLTDLYGKAVEEIGGEE